MTTNQTIDGVPRELLRWMHDFINDGLPLDKEEASVSEKLRALLNKTEADIQASTPQGEPVAWRGCNADGEVVTEWIDGIPPERMADLCGNAARFDKIERAYAEQPAPVAMVPDGYCIMPRQLTAENGDKALLLGEFKLLVTKECPECYELEEPTEGCSICDGEGEYGQKHTIPWDQIKYIYSEAVSGLAVKA